MLSRRCSLSALFLVLSTAALPQQESVTSAVEAYMREHGVTGATVAIGQNGKMVYERAFGMADIEHDVRATTSTVYRLASISKSITAVAVMQLVEAGKVKLDEDARTYVPEFPQKENRFTVRDILCHQSGIRHYKQNEPPGVKRYTSVADSLEVFSGDPLLHEPGTKYGYSTHAYTILARLVEIASGMSFREYLKSQLFKRAGMETTDIEDQQTIVKHRSRGYRKGSDGLLNSPFEDISYKQGGGGIIWVAGDLCRFGMAVHSGLLVKSDTVRQMWTEQKTKTGQSTGYGLGWQVKGAGETLSVGHGGSQFQAKSYLQIEPASGLVVVVLTNYESHNPKQMSDVVLAAWKTSQP